jgi:hypothetical protein
MNKRLGAPSEVSVIRRLGDKSLACSQALPPGRVPQVRGLSRTWVEHDLFPMLSLPVYAYLQGEKRRGFAHLLQPMYAKVREHGAPVQGARPGGKPAKRLDERTAPRSAPLCQRVSVCRLTAFTRKSAINGR